MSALNKSVFDLVMILGDFLASSFVYSEQAPGGKILGLEETALLVVPRCVNTCTSAHRLMTERKAGGHGAWKPTLTRASRSPPELPPKAILQLEDDRVSSRLPRMWLI